MAALFVAQASGVELSLQQQLALLTVALLTSKGAAAVAGGGFVTLAATLAVFPAIPIAGLTLLLGVDRFMAEARSLTNLIGNAVAALVIGRWERAIDMERASQILEGSPALEQPDFGSVPPQVSTETPSA
jgi:aerobic C4-dicarboxylate transport protein